eukprot:gene520-287_t
MFVLYSLACGTLSWTFSVHVSAVGIALDALPRSKLVHRRPDCYVGRTRASAVGKETVDRERKQRPGNLLRSQWTHTEGLSAGFCPPPLLLFASLATAQMYFVGCSSCRQCIILFSSLYPSTTHIIEKTNGRFTIISFFLFVCYCARSEDSVPRYLRMEKHNRLFTTPVALKACRAAGQGRSLFVRLAFAYRVQLPTFCWKLSAHFLSPSLSLVDPLHGSRDLTLRYPACKYYPTF